MAYKNKEDQAKASKRYYEKNKKKVKARSLKSNKVRSDRNKIYIDKIKAERGCVDCGETNPVVLDFDHVRGEKVKCVSDMARQSYGLKTIQAEIDKCEVRCANCHRIVTDQRRNEKRNSNRVKRVCS